ncbi:MAG: PilZ domain-containing protein [Terriglobales bacterium]
MSERNTADEDRDEDRRRSSRFSCGGEARICRLPSNGIFIPGKIRDLSMHGCCIDTPPAIAIDYGVRAEIVVRVNAASFRAVCEVRTIRSSSVTGMEFVHLSAGGRDLLADLVTDLERLQAITNQLKLARRASDARSFRMQLEARKYQVMLLSERPPSLETSPEKLSAGNSRGNLENNPGHNSQLPEQPDSEAQNRIVTAPPFVITVDLFG